MALRLYMIALNYNKTDEIYTDSIELAKAYAYEKYGKQNVHGVWER